jgi:general stress protein CsbA
MKKYFLPFVLIILIAAIGCKKYNQGYILVVSTPPPTEKNG